MKGNRIIAKVKNFSEKDRVLSIDISDPVFLCVVKDIVQLCQKKYGGYIRVEITPPYRQRTLSENAKWWAMCTEYGNYCGMSKEDVAIGVKYRAMEEGLWEGEVIPFSNGIKYPVSTTSADTQEMSVLIDTLYRIAAEDGYTFEY